MLNNNLDVTSTFTASSKKVGNASTSFQSEGSTLSNKHPQILKPWTLSTSSSGILPFDNFEYKSNNITCISEKLHKLLSGSDKKSIVDSNILCYPYKLEEKFRGLKNRGLLVRETTMEIYNLLLSFISNTKEPPSLSLPSPLIWLDGPKQSGKSISLLQIVDMLSRLSNCNILYIPFLSRWITGYYPFEKVSDGLYDQPILSCKILESIMSLNPNLITEYEKYEMGEKRKGQEEKSSESPITFEEILKDKKKVTNFLYQFLSNLVMKRESGKESGKKGTIQMEKQINKPFIIVLDQANALWSKTGYFDQDSNPIAADQLLSIKLLKEVCLLTDYPILMTCTETKPELVKMSNGLVIKNHYKNDKSITNAIDHDSNSNSNLGSNPNLGSDSNFLRQRMQFIKMNGLTTKETGILLKQYKDNGHYYRPVNQEFTKLMSFVSGGNVERLYDACNYEILYVK